MYMYYIWSHCDCVLTGYLFAGLEYRFECWCGDYKYTEHAKLPDSECTSRCSGDLKPLCGGFWRLAIYTTGIYISISYTSLKSQCSIRVMISMVHALIKFHTTCYLTQ